MTQFSTPSEQGIPYTIVYSKRRTLSITVERDRSVVVHAPEGADPAKIRAAVDARRLWIYEKTHHPQKYTPPPPPGKELVNGESLLYLGRQYRVELVDEPGDIRFDDKFLVPRHLYSTKRDAFRAWYRAQAKAVILPRVPAHAATLGVTYHQAKIMDSKYRWGSCTALANVNINWRLIKAPMFVVDYVILHELAHLRVPNHSPDFWNILRTHVPRLDQAKSWLRDHGALLEQDI